MIGRSEVNTMTSEQIDALARKREPLPDTAWLCDMMLYHILLALYGEYSKGIISRDVAKVEKARAIEKHRSLELYERIFRDQAKRMNEIGQLLTEANKNGCPTCKKMAAVFDGRLNRSDKENDV